MFKQKVNGRFINTCYVEGTAGDVSALTALAEGKIEVYEEKFSGGTSAPLPTKMNYISFSVSKKKGVRTYLTASVRVPHIKATKSNEDVEAVVVGAFDAAYNSNEKCETCNLIGSRE